MSILDTIKEIFGKIMADTKPEEGSQTSSPVQKAAEPEVKADPVVKEVKADTKPAAPVAAKVEVKTSKRQVPEDSALKRHFISTLKADVETSIGPRPTDSTLKRHYDAAVQADLENLLN